MTNENLIIPTIDFVKKTFDRFNNLIFKNPLPTPLFRIRNVKSFAGQFRCTTKYNRLTNRHETSDYIITISNNRKRPVAEFEDVIIHEMIHFLIAFNGEKDSAPHGILFKELMTNINKRFNRNVTISIRKKRNAASKSLQDNSESTTINGSGKQEKSYLCLARLTDGRVLIARFAIPVITQIEKQLKEWKLVDSWKWFYSTAPCFNDLPRCRTLKLYTPSSEQLEVLHSGKCISFHVTPDGRLVQNP